MERKVGDKMKNIIEIKNLCRQFDKFVAVNNISFTVKQGELFAFLGTNGAGKSTTNTCFYAGSCAGLIFGGL